MNQIQSQILGLGLGLATAIGCIFYEKLVSNFSYITILIIWLIELILLSVIGNILFESTIKADYKKFISDQKYWWWVIGYTSTAITSLLWYKITKSQGVIVGSLYEIKYIVMLSLIYICFGENKFTLNTGIGLILAMVSIYFISKK